MRPDQARLDSSARISIHASRMGCDRLGVERGTAYLHFNPRIPYGMRRVEENSRTRVLVISIHASRMGCDADLDLRRGTVTVFQSTHPVWDATLTLTDWRIMDDFNPRIPYGMRRFSPTICGS